MFEIMATASLTLALAIPVFMDKVMRPRYEERFEDFRKLLKKNLMLKMTDAVKTMKKSKEHVTSDDYDVMESLFNEWNDVKTNYNKLNRYLRERKLYFGFWMVSFVLSLLACQYSDLPLLLDYNLGRISLIVFFATLIVSVWYVWELFKLDELLSKYKEK